MSQAHFRVHHMTDRRVPAESVLAALMTAQSRADDQRRIVAVYDPAGQLQRPLWDCFGAGDSTLNAN